MATSLTSRLENLSEHNARVTVHSLSRNGSGDCWRLCNQSVIHYNTRDIFSGQSDGAEAPSAANFQIPDRYLRTPSLVIGYMSCMRPLLCCMKFDSEVLLVPALPTSVSGDLPRLDPVFDVSSLHLGVTHFSITQVNCFPSTPST